MIEVHIKRVNEHGVTYIKHYEVMREKNDTVLQIIKRISKELEPNLAYRYSCRFGVCGTCSVLVNGKPALICLKKVELNDDGILLIEALPGRKTIADLANQM